MQRFLIFFLLFLSINLNAEYAYNSNGSYLAIGWYDIAGCGAPSHSYYSNNAVSFGGGSPYYYDHSYNNVLKNSSPPSGWYNPEGVCSYNFESSDTPICPNGQEPVFFDNNTTMQCWDKCPEGEERGDDNECHSVCSLPDCDTLLSRVQTECHSYGVDVSDFNCSFDSQNCLYVYPPTYSCSDTGHCYLCENEKADAIRDCENQGKILGDFSCSQDEISCQLLQPTTYNCIDYSPPPDNNDSVNPVPDTNITVPPPLPFDDNTSNGDKNNDDLYNQIGSGFSGLEGQMGDISKQIGDIGKGLGEGFKGVRDDLSDIKDSLQSSGKALPSDNWNSLYSEANNIITNMGNLKDTILETVRGFTMPTLQKGGSTSFTFNIFNQNVDVPFCYIFTDTGLSTFIQYFIFVGLIFASIKIVIMAIMFFVGGL